MLIYEEQNDIGVMNIQERKTHFNQMVCSPKRFSCNIWYPQHYYIITNVHVIKLSEYIACYKLLKLIGILLDVGKERSAKQENIMVGGIKSLKANW